MNERPMFWNYIIYRDTSWYEEHTEEVLIPVKKSSVVKYAFEKK